MGRPPDVRLLSTGIGTGSAVTTTSNLVPSNTITANVYYFWALITSGAPFTDTATLTGGGLTWTKKVGIINSNDYFVVFEGVGTANSSALTFTNSRTPTAGRYACVEVDLGNGDAPPSTAGAGYTNSASGTGTTGTITISKPSEHYQYGVSFWGHKAAEVTTPDSTGITWTEAYDLGTTYGMECQYVAQTPGAIDHTATWATSSWWGGALFMFDKTDYGDFDRPPAGVLDPVVASQGLATAVASDADGDPEGVWGVVG